MRLKYLTISLVVGGLVTYLLTEMFHFKFSLQQTLVMCIVGAWVFSFWVFAGLKVDIDDLKNEEKMPEENKEIKPILIGVSLEDLSQRLSIGMGGLHSAEELNEMARGIIIVNNAENLKEGMDQLSKAINQAVPVIKDFGLKTMQFHDSPCVKQMRAEEKRSAENGKKHYKQKIK